MPVKNAITACGECFAGFNPEDFKKFMNNPSKGYSQADFFEFIQVRLKGDDENIKQDKVRSPCHTFLHSTF